MFAIKNLLTEIDFARMKTVTSLDMPHFSINEDKLEMAFNYFIVGTLLLFFFISTIYTYCNNIFILEYMIFNFK